MLSVFYTNKFTDDSMMDVAATLLLGLPREIRELLDTRVGHVSVKTVCCSLAKIQDSPKQLIAQDISQIMPSPFQKTRQSLRSSERL